MFNLNEEQYNELYSQFLAEQGMDQMETAVEDLEEASREAQLSLDLMESYFKSDLNEANPVSAGSDSKVGETATSSSKSNDHDASSANPNRKQDGSGSQYRDYVTNIFSGAANPLDKEDGKSKFEYMPMVGQVQVEKMSEMKFPDNVIFFITQVINFIKNVIFKFFQIARNAIRGLLGMENKEKVDFSDLSLKLEKSKEIDRMGLPVFGKPGDPIALKSVDASGIKALSSFFESDMRTIPDAVSLTEAPGDAAQADGSSNDDERHFHDFLGGDHKPDKPSEYPGKTDEKKSISVISVDVSKELEELEQYLQHFFDLFDSSYGSYNEKLFDTQDLEMLLNVFKGTIGSIKSGSVPAYEISGRYTEVSAVDSRRTKDALLRTKTNIDALKAAYTATEKQVSVLLQMIGHKQLIGSTSMGVAFKYYSAASYESMIRLLKVIKPRLKDAEKMERKMQKMQDAYDDIVVELGKERTALAGIGNVAYSSVYQSRISDLFESARYMSQMVTLRLTALSLYVKELQDIDSAIKAANAINDRGGFFKRTIDRWSMRNISA